MVSARAAALHALVALDRARSERLREVLDGLRLAGREQALAFELAHGVVRRERLLDHVLQGLAHRGLPKDPQLLAALRLGAYQLLFVSGMPAHAAVHETVALLRRNQAFVNALLRRVAVHVESRPADAFAPCTELALGPRRALRLPVPLPAEPVVRLGILHSLPDFLLQRWAGERSLAELEQIAAAASAVPGVFLRLAPGNTATYVKSALAAADVQVAETDHPGLLRWIGGASPFGTAVFREGRFLAQDPTALRAVEQVPVAAGATVIDLCAAPGTKTMWLAERVGPNGVVFAYDPVPARRERIAENAARLRLRDRVRVVADPRELPAAADAVLADVPCSNSGVLGRRVEVRRRLEPAVFGELAALQAQILAQAIGHCRPGGTVVYSTCSIDREENEAVVERVLADPATPPCTRVAAATTLPLAGSHDGGFHAVLRRALPGPAGDG